MSDRQALADRHVPLYRRNTAGAAEIARHLLACDEHFRPALSGRVDIADYAGRLAASAERFEAWDGDRLVGLVAAYCNRPEIGTAFVSSVSVLPRCHGAGIAARLMQDCLAHAARAHPTGAFRRIELRVAAGNAPAVSLYAKLGFTRAGEDRGEIVLRRDLQHDDRSSAA